MLGRGLLADWMIGGRCPDGGVTGDDDGRPDVGRPGDGRPIWAMPDNLTCGDITSSGC